MTDWIDLRAGPLRMFFDPEWAFLRRIRLGDREVVRCIYATPRDEHWATPIPEVSNLHVERREDSFELGFDVACKLGTLDFAWHGAITGEADGTVCFTMKGVARSTFKRNRLGFCVLHPLREYVGGSCTIEHPDGSTEESRFPTAIAPHQPFRNVRAITREAVPGVAAEVRCEGDVFETEDQRNWTDGSFKTYCTPLDLPRPVEVPEGTTVEQSITLSLKGEAPPSVARLPEEGPVRLAIADAPVGPLPELGLGLQSHGQPLAGREIPRLKALNLAHLRAELDLSKPDWREVLALAAKESVQLDVPVEMAVLVPEAARDALAELRDALAEGAPRIARWLLFPAEARGTTPPGLVPLARELLPGDRFGGGTNRYFTELNRERPPFDELDLVAYSFNPQVHTFDEASMVESLEGQAWTVRSAREFAGGLPIAVGPVTLKPRKAGASEGELPPNVDPRQASLFAAVWTLGSIRVLAENGVHSATYFETTGWFGVMETRQGSPLPEQFPSMPGTVFPVYHVLAALGGFARGEVFPVTSTDERAVVGLAVSKGGKRRLLLANLTDLPQQASVRGMRGVLSVHSLNASNVAQASRAPEVSRAKVGDILSAAKAEFSLELPPYGLARVDAAQ